MLLLSLSLKSLSLCKASHKLSELLLGCLSRYSAGFLACVEASCNAIVLIRAITAITDAIIYARGEKILWQMAFILAIENAVLTRRSS